MTEKLPQLNSDHEVCDTCHKKIPKLKCDESDSDETEQSAKITAMQSLNESVLLTGESPIKNKRLGEGHNPTSKMKRTGNAVKTKILNIVACTATL
jgi:hypothetical protein